MNVIIFMLYIIFIFIIFIFILYLFIYLLYFLWKILYLRVPSIIYFVWDMKLICALMYLTCKSFKIYCCVLSLSPVSILNNMLFLLHTHFHIFKCNYIYINSKISFFCKQKSSVFIRPILTFKVLKKFS